LKHLKVKPSQVKIPELRVKAKFDQETMAQFQSTIKQLGIISPLITCQVGEDLVLIDGEHRLQEAVANGIQSIDVVVIDGDMVDVLTTNLFIDHTRGKHSVSDMVMVIKALYTDYNLDSDQIRERTGLTRDYIEKLIRISQASPSVQQALDEGIIGVGHAFELSRLPVPIQQDEIIAKHQVWRFTVKELRDQINQVMHEMDLLKETPVATAPGEPRPAPVYHCEGCKEEVDPHYLRPVMVCPDCFGAVWRLAKGREVPEVKVIESTGGG